MSSPSESVKSVTVSSPKATDATLEDTASSVLAKGAPPGVTVQWLTTTPNAAFEQWMGDVCARSVSLRPRRTAHNGSGLRPSPLPRTHFPLFAPQSGHVAMPRIAEMGRPSVVTAATQNAAGHPSSAVQMQRSGCWSAIGPSPLAARLLRERMTRCPPKSHQSPWAN